MKRNRKKGFTLIELIAVLVILAVIALIVTPLVLNIVKKAKDSANKRSVDAYGKAVELAVATYLLDTGDYPTSLEDLTVEYTGNEVLCNVKNLNEDGSIYLSECTVKGTEVKDSKTDDGWYHYGKTTSNVITYDAYKIGDTVTYNGMEFYVIANSDETSDSVTLLKSEPLTADEVNTYGAGRINKYTSVSQGTAYNEEGYGGMVYYTSETCGYIDGSPVLYDCTTDYDVSDVKYVVNGWTIDKFSENNLTLDSLGYKARLITYEELVNNLECTSNDCTLSQYNSWLYNEKYNYWTMSQYNDTTSVVKGISRNGSFSGNAVYNDYNLTVRPVVTLLKSAL